ncbi:MAG: carboxylesterase family protein [Gammaproteobacteria bacterium]|nr:carboxylesterase family protein [Gammaproteobacteria bacterium]MDP7455625.1 carboxylesterase family protein [Gammaproteobacteria bacterium]
MHTLLRKIINMVVSLVISLWMSGIYGAEITTVVTDSGQFSGSPSDYATGVTVFKGISYAAPPVRDLRWKPPVAPIPFAGVRQANKIGPACWQARNSDNSLYARGNLERSEDCLYLNVFTGAQDSADSLPVMVWYHGGGNTAGHGGPLIFDGSNLAARGAVIITANYRLGALGFLTHSTLTTESENNSSGNYGILDQLAVLEWVQNNIVNFGGDPDRVTIFGQSAGGTDVCLIMSSPLAEGMIDGVIGQSPGCIKMDRQLSGTENSGHQSGALFAGALGISGGNDVLEQLRAIPAEEIIATRGGTGPIIDGWVIPDEPYSLLESGSNNNIPVMVGGLAHENHGLQAGSPPITEEQLDTFLKAGFGERAAQVKSNYSDMLALSPLDARKQVATDNGFLLSSRMWGRLVQQRGNNAYVYFFMREPPAFRLYMPEQPVLNSDGGQRSYGAYHSGELAFVFDNLDLVGIGWDAEDHALSELVADYWVSFASNGNPNADGLPIWPAYNASEDRVQILDSQTRSAVHPKKAELDLLEEIYLDSR